MLPPGPCAARSGFTGIRAEDNCRQCLIVVRDIFHQGAASKPARTGDCLLGPPSFGTTQTHQRYSHQVRRIRDSWDIFYTRDPWYDISSWEKNSYVRHIAFFAGRQHAALHLKDAHLNDCEIILLSKPRRVSREAPPASEHVRQAPTPAWLSTDESVQCLSWTVSISRPSSHVYGLADGGRMGEMPCRPCTKNRVAPRQTHPDVSANSRTYCRADKVLIIWLNKSCCTVSWLAAQRLWRNTGKSCNS